MTDTPQPESENEKKTVLVVEDELPLRKAMRDRLVEAGFTVYEAGDGAEGLTVALAKHPQVILLDVLMPMVSGLDMAAHLRQDPWGKQVPVVILSNIDGIGQVQEALDQGIYTYLVKEDTSLDEIVAKATALAQ